MLSRDLLRQIRRLQIRARRAVEDLLGGNYRSVFKGAGMAFEEVREYQPGDDIRTIDWNVTARMGHPFVKRFVEERELTLVLLLDVSGSQYFTTQWKTKRDVMAELAALLAFCALANNDKVGLALCSEKVEKYVPPRKGARHVLRLLREALFYEPQKPGTNLRAGLDFINKVLHRRAIVFCLSDFLDQGYEAALRRTARRHDLVALEISDPRERQMPAAGLVVLQDAETGRELWVDSGNAAFQSAWQDGSARRRERLRQLGRFARVDWVDISTAADQWEALVAFFRMRQRRFGRT
ncbi:MAG: DUF58 domain-containing protein [Gemmataceae bacterium]|nr:DUF58 domain-containing protein [Gemmataceae bacterium]MCI0738027.1 DUF58 domain-containing protein [Gemmataceae bacterium]